MLSEYLPVDGPHLKAGAGATLDPISHHSPSPSASNLKPKVKLIMPLPPSTQLLDHQIAGHRHGEGKNKLGMLRHTDGSILKPLMPNDARAKREHDFYLVLEEHRRDCDLGNCTDPDLHDLTTITPRYLGVFDGDIASSRVSYMKLEDICSGFGQPCIADIKFGRLVHDPEATAEKIAQSTGKYPAQKEIGFRILGMRVYKEGQCKVYDADYGLAQTPATVNQALKTFMSANPKCIKNVLQQLEQVHTWFQKQTRFAFYSSSILFVYDALQERTAVKMIDFAHVFPITNGETDQNYLFGLTKLLDAFKEI